jgi:hypothetical protein
MARALRNDFSFPIEQPHRSNMEQVVLVLGGTLFRRSTCVVVPAVKSENIDIDIEM